MNIAGLDLYLFLISQHAGSWLNAYISSPAKNKQQIDLRASGTNRKGLFSVLIFYHLFINQCLFFSLFFCIRVKQKSPFVPLFHRYLMCTFYVPGATIGPGNKE